MTTDPSAARPGKIAGLVLIGVAAVSTVLGVVTLLGGNGDSEAGQQPPQSSAPPASQPSAAPPSTPGSEPGTSSAAPTTTTAPPITTAPPATSAPAPGSGEPGTPSTKDQPVRIYNNSTIADLASRARNDLTGHGWNVIETGNYSQGIIPTTTVYFVPGTAEEAAARALAAEFGIRVEPRFDGIKDSSPGLILIVTKDYRGAAGKE
ncbi:LytR C-terminal domain-containing protein [Actinokineospora sp.]|uniref:LytR C-terminal domain-containing protein n=1 Tax=Actinokineospora sp. TaxID=1872133 RepID=UPI003D6C0316